MRIWRAVPWFSIAMLGIILAIQLITEVSPGAQTEIHGHLAADWNDLVHFRIHRLVLAPFVQSDAGVSWTILGLIVIAIPLYEYRVGSPRAAITFFAGDIASTLLVLAAVRIAAGAGSEHAMSILNRRDSGASSGCFACLGALAISLRGSWRATALVCLGAFLAFRVAGWRSLSDTQHAVAAACGMAIWVGLRTYWPRREA